jgi:hypothetical protein
MSESRTQKKFQKRKKMFGNYKKTFYIAYRLNERKQNPKKSLKKEKKCLEITKKGFILHTD